MMIKRRKILLIVLKITLRYYICNVCPFMDFHPCRPNYQKASYNAEFTITSTIYHWQIIRSKTNRPNVVPTFPLHVFMLDPHVPTFSFEENVGTYVGTYVGTSMCVPTYVPAFLLQTYPSSQRPSQGHVPTFVPRCPKVLVPTLFGAVRQFVSVRYSIYV